MSKLPTPYFEDNIISINEILEHYDTLIVSLAHQKVPRNVVASEQIDLEADELAQNTRLKFWLALRKGNIVNYSAYIRSIIYTECVNIVRQHKPVLPLSTDQNGELCHGEVMMTPSEGMDDPSYEFEQKETIANYVMKILDVLSTLPPRQHYALMCTLKDLLAEFHPLIDILKDYGVDIEMVKWPEDKDDVNRLKASLAATRKKLRSVLET